MTKLWTAIKIVGIATAAIAFALLMGLGYVEVCREISR